jgi:putative PEP-CTERM system TPR-repeat lipoprotein
MGIWFRKSFLVIAVGFLIACSGDSTGNKNVEEAKNYLAAGKRKAAVIELKNALQKNANHQEARWLLGRAYFNQGLYADAVKELTRAEELGYSSEEVLPILAQCLFSLGESDKLQALSLDDLSNSARSYVLASQGMDLVRKGEVDEAELLIEKAISLSKTAFSMEAKARLMGIQSKGDWMPVREQLQKVFELDPNYAPAWSLLGDVELRSLNLDLAEKAYTNAINNAGYNLDGRYKRALVRLQMDDEQGAKEDIDVLLKKASQSPGTHYLRGILHFRNREYKDAISALEVVQSAEDRYPMSLFYLATAHNFEGNQTLAEDYAYRFLAIAPDNAAGRKLLATMKLKSGEGAEAESLIRPVVESESEDVNSLNILSSALLNQGKVDEGIALLAKIAKLQPESPEAQIRLGAGLMASGKVSGGMEHIQEAMKLNPQLQQADALMVTALLRQKDFDGALRVVDEFEKKNPDSAIPHTLRGEVHVAEGNMEEARLSFEKALEITPGDAGVNQSLAFLAIKENDFESARKYYSNVLKHDENNLPVLLKLAALSEVQRDTAGMVKYLEQAMEAHPDQVAPKVMLARYYLSIDRPEQVPILLNELDPKEASQPNVLNVMGLAHLNKKQYYDAIAVFQKLVSVKGDAPQPHHNMALAYLGLGKRDKARSEFGKAVEISPAYLAPRIELTRLLLQEKDRDNALDNLSVLKKLSPEHPEVLQLDATRARLDGNQDEALELSKAAFEKDPSTRNMLVLAHQHWSMEEQDTAWNMLKDWVNNHPDDVLANLELADMYMGKGDEEKAADAYNRVLSVQKDNTLALNNLAWLLRDSEPETALSYAQQAVDQSKDSPLALDTLAVVLLKNNEPEKAQRMIERALEKASENPSIIYHSAMINAAAGNKAKAKKDLEKLLSADAVFPEKPEAEALLKQL